MADLPTIPQSIVSNEPELSDLLNLFRKDLMLQFNCHHLGTVKSFDDTRQVANVTINYRRTYFKPNAQGVLQAELKSYPIIVDAPVIVLNGGGYALTFPIAAGDECLVLFNDRDIDTWFAGSSDSPNASPRLHSFSDAVILVGLKSLKNVLASYDTDGVALRNLLGTVKLKLKTSGEIKLQNPIGYFKLFDNADVGFDTGTVVGLFGNSGKVKFTNATGEYTALLYTMLNALLTATAGGFPLVIPPAFATALTQFLTFKT